MDIREENRSVAEMSGYMTWTTYKFHVLYIFSFPERLTSCTSSLSPPTSFCPLSLRIIITFHSAAVLYDLSRPACCFHCHHHPLSQTIYVPLFHSLPFFIPNLFNLGFILIWTLLLQPFSYCATFHMADLVLLRGLPYFFSFFRICFLPLSYLLCR